MNKAVTEDIRFSPPGWAEGLNRWSRGDGLPGSPAAITGGNIALVPADGDFGDCIEVLKTERPQRLRCFDAMPVLAGCYVRVRIRAKVMSGNLPQISLAATPVGRDGREVGGLARATAPVALTQYGRVVEIEAVIGTGARRGVDLPWDSRVVRAHLGLDLTGANGGVLRIDDIVAEDVTGAFLRDMMDWVDVRDYGARGDGAADDTEAFEAADRASGGRTILVPEGVFRLTRDVTLNAPVRFEGTLAMPLDRRLSLVRSFDLPTYAAAFGSDEAGLERGIQALFTFADHDALDLCGRQVELTRPLSVQFWAGRTSFANQRSIKNGQIAVGGGAAFDTAVRTGDGTYSRARPAQLTDVTGIAAIEVGSLVQGAGVGREVYVAGKDDAARVLYLSQPLWGPPARQGYTFRRFRYALDFSGFANLQRFTLEDIEFLLAGNASGVLLPNNGLIFHVKDCFFTAPRDRGVTSHATGCAGLLIDRCQFLSKEGPAPAQTRETIAFNVNRNDAKVRNNRAVRFLHFGVMSGSGHIVTGNHFFQGDDRPLGQRTAGIVFAEPQCKTVLMSNYIDNCYVEWTNEHDNAPEFASEYSFGGLQMIGNIVFSIDVPASFAPIHVKPYGPGHFLNGVTITGNNFKTIAGQALNRVDFVDTTHAALDTSRFADVNIHSNTFHGVRARFENPVTVPVVSNSPQWGWDVNLGDQMPFGGRTRLVQAVQPDGRIRDANNGQVWSMPFAEAGLGAGGQFVRVNWPTPAKGKVFVTARCDAAN